MSNSRPYWKQCGLSDSELLGSPKAHNTTAWLEKASANVAKVEKNCEMLYVEKLSNIINGQSATKTLKRVRFNDYPIGKE